MRLEFNVILVDDDLHDANKNESITILIESLRIWIGAKGFNANIQTFSNSADALAAGVHRGIDLYLSDQNLGDNASIDDDSKSSDGIKLYFNLKTQYICDFVLYTKSDAATIIDELVNELTQKMDPNLFSRFTFVSREDGADDWHDEIKDVIDHLLTKREELNTLRAIYAHQTSKIDEHLRRLLPHRPNPDRFGTVIDNTDAIRFSGRLSRSELHEIRRIRNGLVHNDEQFCTIRNLHYIAYKNITPGQPDERIYENDLQQFRDRLKNALDEISLWV